MNTIYGVALGPGDPELLTLKALRVLKEADIIFYPGSIFQGIKKSYVHPILAYHHLDKKELHGFFLEMSSDRTAATAIYNKTFEKIQIAYNSGKKVAVVCEGDLSLYASFSYILELVKENNLPVSLIPGINSFSLGASEHQIPLSILNDKVAIVPRVKNIEEIDTYLKNFDTIILMKIRKGWEHFYLQLKEKDWSCYYCERLGTDNAFITEDLSVLKRREIPYFSLLIIKK